MSFIKSITVFVIIVALFACLVVFPFVYVVDKTFLSEKYYTETLDELGVYDNAYDLFITKIDSYSEKKGFKEGLPKDSVEWILGNVKTIMEREYVKDILKHSAAGMVVFLRGDSDKIPRFNLEPKYDELKAITTEQLDAEKVMSLMQMPTESIPLDFLTLFGIIDTEGDFNNTLKTEMINLIFDSNDKIKEPFLIKSPIDAMEFMGMENAQVRIEEFRERIIFFHRSIMVLLMFISFLTAFLILMFIKKLRTPFLIIGYVYTFASLFSIIGGTAIAAGNKGINNILNKRLVTINMQLASIIDIKQVTMPLSKEILSIGLILLGVAIVFFILAIVLNSRLRRRTENAV